MNKEELRRWQDGVLEHCKNVQDMIRERNLLKKHFEEHLSNFFDWHSIKYDKDFNKIELSWEFGHNPVIKQDIGDLGMEWIIRADYDDKAFRIVVIEVYPFGLPEIEEEED